MFNMFNLEQSSLMSTIPKEQIKRELLAATIQLSTRGLLHSAKWVAEFLNVNNPSSAISESDLIKHPLSPLLTDHEDQYTTQYMLAKVYFDLKEYYRASYVLKDACSDKSIFLKCYALFLAGERRKQEEQQELGEPQTVVNRELKGLREDLGLLFKEKKLDSFSSYLLAIVLGHLKDFSKQSSGNHDVQPSVDEMTKGGMEGKWMNSSLTTHHHVGRFHQSPLTPTSASASRLFTMKTESDLHDVHCSNEEDTLQRTLYITSIQQYPWNWSVWLDLTTTIANDRMLRRIHDLLPDHYFKPFWLAHALLELQQNQQALVIYEALDKIYPNFQYIQSQMAITHHNMLNLDPAQKLFEKLLQSDPYRLTGMDTYSNILYIKEDSAKLSYLAYKASVTAKYTSETCCITGNYYSLRGEHEKAVVYFERALKLNPLYLAAWTLIGHEYIEMKNTAGAISAYRKAVDINQRDFRAWYSLGQTYELLRMPLYALYYFERACELRPYDSRMWCAMGGCYEAIHHPSNAILCYKRAEMNGDQQGIVFNKLGKLFEKLGSRNQAAYYFKKNLNLRDQEALESQDVVDALLFLAHHAKSTGEIEVAINYCSRLLDFAGREKEEAKALLREIHSCHSQKQIMTRRSN